MQIALEMIRQLHKDVYGVYPSTWWMQCWEVATEDERIAEYEDLWDKYFAKYYPA